MNLSNSIAGFIFTEEKSNSVFGWIKVSKYI